MPLADVGVPGREPDTEGVPEDSALPLSRTKSGSLGDCCDRGDAEVLEVADAGDTFRESLVAGG